VHALLRRFVQLLEADLAPVGFVRRGPVFRYFDLDGNGIALDIQRSTALRGEVEFYLNVGVLLAPHLRHLCGADDPRRNAMPGHGVWQHRLVAPDDTATQKFSLSTEADAERAATGVRTWLAANLPRMKSRLGGFDAMLAAVEEDRAQSTRARAGYLGGQWTAGRQADGIWDGGIIRAYAYAERGDVEAVTAETADWYDDGDPDSLAAEILAIAHQRRQGTSGR
jgi:hypothetical protein